jgi:hypothetical protein
VMARRLFLGFSAMWFLLVLPGCGSSGAQSSDEDSYSTAGYSGDDEDSATPAEFDEDAARADAEQEVADEGYSGPCTMDCSGHDAGFAWAAEGHQDYGTSTSQSFDEGQEAYEGSVQQRVEEKREQFDEEGSDSDYAE